MMIPAGVNPPYDLVDSTPTRSFGFTPVCSTSTHPQPCAPTPLRYDFAVTLDDRANPYFEGYDSSAASSPSPDEYEYTAYNEIAELLETLGQFAAEAHPSNFDTINKRLKEVHSLIQEAVVFDWNEVHDALSHWGGMAADNFRRVVISPFSGTLLRQANLAKEIATAALCYKSIVVRTRADILDLTHQMKDKVTHSDGSGGTSFGFTDLLFVVGAAASGAALVTASPVSWPPLISWAAGTTSGVIRAIEEDEAQKYALDGIDQVSGRERPDKRTIRGSWACEFIPSAYEILEMVQKRALDEEDYIKDGLLRDFQQLEESDLALELKEPELATVDTDEELGVSENLTIFDIVALKKVGNYDLPAVAEMLHQAHYKVAVAADLLNTGLGNQIYVGSHERYFYEAVNKLLTALTDTRDFLYESGQNLVTVADGYYATEEEARLALEQLIRQDPRGAETLEEFIDASDYPEGVTPDNIGFDDLYREAVDDLEGIEVFKDKNLYSPPEDVYSPERHR
jgi:hypothetical protein